MMTHSERDQRIQELTAIERAHPEAVKHERSMLEYAEKKLTDAIADGAEIKALWEAFSPHCDQALRDGLLTPALHATIKKHRGSQYDPAAVPTLGLKVEEARTALYAALVHVEAGQLAGTAQKG